MTRVELSHTTSLRHIPCPCHSTRPTNAWLWKRGLCRSQITCMSTTSWTLRTRCKPCCHVLQMAPVPTHLTPNKGASDCLLTQGTRPSGLLAVRTDPGPLRKRSSPFRFARGTGSGSRSNDMLSRQVQLHRMACIVALFKFINLRLAEIARPWTRLVYAVPMP